MHQRLINCLALLVVLFCLSTPALANEAALTDADQNKLARLTDDLSSEDPETLDLALQGLLAMGPKAAGALEPLTKMLADGRSFTYPTVRSRSLRRSFQVNVSVVGVLRSIGPKAVPALVKALDKQDEKVRLPAIEALYVLEQTVELGVWRTALKDSNQYVQIYAARGLSRSKSPAARDALCETLHDESLEVRIEVAKALGEIGDRRAVAPLINSVPESQSDWKLIVAIGLALGKIGAPAVEALLEKESLTPAARGMANIAIGEVDATKARPHLLKCLKHGHWQLREAALRALAKLQTAESRRIVTAAAIDPDRNVRWTAARLLGELADEKSADAFRELLLKMANDDPEAKVRDNALWTLYFFPGIPTKEYWNALEAALRDSSPRVRATATSSCSKFPNKRFIPRLKKLLDDPDAGVRAESAGALGQVKAADAVLDLIRLLDDKDERCASYAAVALGQIGSDKAVAGLVEIIEDESAQKNRRNLALYGLSFTTNQRAVNAMRAASEDLTFRRNHERVKSALKRLETD